MLPATTGRDALSPIAVDDSVESLLAHGTSGTTAVYACIVLLVIGGLLAAALTPVDQSIRAVATIGPVVERQSLRNPGDGRVARVLVQLGSRVNAGDTVLVLDPGERQAAADGTRAALADQRRLTGDLKQLLSADADVKRWQPQSLSLDRTRAWARSAALEWRQGSTDVTRTERVHRRSAELAARGFAERVEVEDAELELGRAREARALALERHRSEWSTQLATAADRVRELERDLAMHAHEASRRVVIAPVSGSVEELAPLTPGTTLRAGDPIALISPDGALAAIALVPSRDAVHLRPGMPARLLLEGYDVQEWGSVPAEVTAVAGDYTLADGAPVFRVSVRALATELRRADGRSTAIRKGLRCQVRFLIGRRTLGDIARRRAGEWLNPSRPGT